MRNVLHIINNLPFNYSIRANQHTETLQAQNSLLTQRYDEIVAKLSAAEDREAQHQTALFNLQLALEQFQNSINF